MERSCDKLSFDGVPRKVGELKGRDTVGPVLMEDQPYFVGWIRQDAPLSLVAMSPTFTSPLTTSPSK